MILANVSGSYSGLQNRDHILAMMPMILAVLRIWFVKIHIVYVPQVLFFLVLRGLQRVSESQRYRSSVFPS